MARYRDVAADLRGRLGREFSVGDRLPSIGALQEHYDVPGLNTIRASLRLLADEGLIRTDPGVGSFVIATPAPDGEKPATLDDVLAAYEALGRTLRSYAGKQ